MHHLIANHQQILSETVYRSFEVPLLHELDQWRRSIEDEDETYKREAATRSREIRRLEKEGLKLHRQQRRRDVAKFREHLVTLTGRLDGLTALHADHARTLLRDSQETSTRILDASCSLVRAEVDIFESLAKKGWTGGGLDELLEKGQDLFASEENVPAAATGGVITGGGNGDAGTGDGGGAGGAAKLFSILPPKSILANDTAEDTPPRTHGRADSLLVDADEDRYQSLTGAVDRRGRGATGGDSESIFSESNAGRGLRPFSPQPIRRRPTDVIIDPEALLLGRSHGGNNEDTGNRGDNSNDDDYNEDEGEDEYDSATIKRGARDASAQGLSQGLRGLSIRTDQDHGSLNGDEPESPWKNEGLRVKSSSSNNEHSNSEQASRPSTSKSRNSNSGSGG